MAKTAEEIISLVNEIQKAEDELEKLRRSLSNDKRYLEDFKDTGNEYLAVSFNHGNGWKNLYYEFSGNYYPSDKVREAVLADLELAIERMEAEERALEEKISFMKESLVG
jgi:septation ring formation regulator EzrA